MKQGGFKIGTFKELTINSPIQFAGIPEKVYLPLGQNRGAPAPRCILKSGDDVCTGQIIAQSVENGIPLHSSITGRIYDITTLKLPNGQSSEGIIIESNGFDQWITMKPLAHWEKESVQMLLSRIRDAGIVGLGGAAFPMHLKLQPVETKAIETIIINGCECEPFLTSDYRIMIEHADQLIEGTRISMYMTGAKQGIIAIEKCHTKAIEAIQKSIQPYPQIVIKKLPNRYPQGAEKVIIQSCTKKRVGSRQLPRDVGVVVHNAGSTIALYCAIVEGHPLVERVVTVSGDAIGEPRNLRVRIGTPLQYILDFCKIDKSFDGSYILGGPMMGTLVDDLHIGITKGTSALLALSKKITVTASKESLPCINCGRCIECCPRGQMPSLLMDIVENNCDIQQSSSALQECLECGTCSYICPSHRALSETIRNGKQLLSQKNQNKPKEIN